MEKDLPQNTYTYVQLRPAQSLHFLIRCVRKKSTLEKKFNSLLYANCEQFLCTYVSSVRAHLQCNAIIIFYSPNSWCGWSLLILSSFEQLGFPSLTLFVRFNIQFHCIRIAFLAVSFLRSDLSLYLFVRTVHTYSIIMSRNAKRKMHKKFQAVKETLHRTLDWFYCCWFPFFFLLLFFSFFFCSGSLYSSAVFRHILPF